LAKLRRRQAEQPGRPLFLVVGSSRIRLSYLPESAPRVLDARGRPVLTFNFPHNGMGPVLQHLYLRRLLREGVRPDLVVLEVMPLYVNHEPGHFMMRFVLPQEWPVAASYLGLGSTLRNAARRQLEIYPEALRTLFPGDLRRLVPPGPMMRVGQTLALGGPARLPDSVSAANQEEVLDLQRLTYSTWDGPDIAPRAERALRDSLALCRRENIDVVLLLTPEGEVFRCLYPPGVEETI